MDNSKKFRVRKWIILVLSLLGIPGNVIVTTVVTLVGTKYFPDNTIMAAAFGEIIAGIVAVIGMFILGGKRWLSVDRDSISYVFRIGWTLLIVGIAVNVIQIAGFIRNGKMPEPGALARLGSTALLCVGIGLLEEALFRGIIFGGLLGVFGGSKKGIMFSVIVQSILFGIVHVGIIDSQDTLVLLQAVLKIVQTGMFGIVLCAAVLHSQKLGGVMIFHALNDFLLMFLTTFMEDVSVSAEYTSSDSAWQGVLVYVLWITAFVYPTVKAIRIIWRENDCDYGPFARTG